MAIMSVIRACNGQRQDEFKASLGYIENKKLAQARLCLNKTRLWETPTGFLLKMGPRWPRKGFLLCALVPILPVNSSSLFLSPGPMAHEEKDLDVQTRDRASHTGQRAQGMQAANGNETHGRNQPAARCQPVFI